MKKQVIFFLFFLNFFSGSLLALNDRASLPPASKILQKVWSNMKWEPFLMKGVLRTRQDRYLLTLKTKPYEMEYELENESPRYIRIELNTEGSRVWKRASLYEAWEEIAIEKWKIPLLKTDATYEDLAFDFLTWSTLKEVGTDSFKTISTFVIDAFPNSRPSSYSKVRLWISQEYNMVVRADAYNAEGQIIKRLEVNGVQNIGSVWFLKELQISTRMKDRDLAKSRSYLEIQKAESLIKVSKR